jgi:hypothetical protein
MEKTTHRISKDGKWVVTKTYIPPNKVITDIKAVKYFKMMMGVN